jgi:hypothetical protein
MNNVNDIHTCIYCGIECSIYDIECIECYTQEMTRVMSTEAYDQKMNAWFEEQMLEALCAEYASRSYDEPLHYEIA